MARAEGEKSLIPDNAAGQWADHVHNLQVLLLRHGMSLPQARSGLMQKRNAVGRQARKVRKLPCSVVEQELTCVSAGRVLYTTNWERTPEQRKVCLALEDVAKQLGVKSITAGLFFVNF